MLGRRERRREPGVAVAAGWPGFRPRNPGAFSFIFLADYPPMSGVEDEIGFVNQALVWSRGAVTAEGAGWPGLMEFEPVRPGGWQVATRAGRS